MDKILKARCGGLLEIRYGNLKTATPLPTMKVAYLHRTVREFIMTMANWEALLKGTSEGPTREEAFNPDIAILKSMILQIKDHEDSTAHGLINCSFTFIQRIGNDKSVPPAEFEKLFDAFSRVATAGRYVILSADHDHEITDDEMDITSELETLMSLLRKHGVNPNQPLNGVSAWQSALLVASNCETASPSAKIPLGTHHQSFLR